MPNQPQDYDPYKGPSKQPMAVDISKQDKPSTGVNEDAAELGGVNENGYGVGIRLFDETGQESNFRRNPETGELYDATGLQ